MSLICGISKKMIQMIQNRLTDIENKHIVTKEETGPGDKLGIWD